MGGIDDLLSAIPIDLAERLALVYKPDANHVFTAARPGEPTLAGAIASGASALSGRKPPTSTPRVCVRFGRDGRPSAADRGGRKDLRRSPQVTEVVQMLESVAARLPARALGPRPGSPALSSVPQVSHLIAGDIVGQHYTITRLLGEGGFGRAYEASFALLPDRPRVLKFAHDKSRAESLRHEVSRAMYLGHDNVCRIIDLGYDDRHGLFLILEHGGQSLVDLCRDAPLPVERALNIVTQAAAGIDYLHRNKLIHGDINPGNVLVSEDGRVRISDFGVATTLARVQATDGHETERGTMVRGVHQRFSAPEVLLRDELRPSSDQYSLALVLCVLLQGYDAFCRSREQSPPSLTEAQQQALGRALEHDPSGRFESCGKFASALHAA